MDIFLEEHKRFLNLLLKHEVNFMLVGGYAVIVYGYARGTSDMDIWLQPTNENKINFIQALAEHGINVEHLEKVKSMDFTQTHVMHIGDKPNKIDFLTKVQGVRFDEAEKEKMMLPFGNHSLPIIQYHHLIQTKISTGRAQDKADVEILQKIHQHKTGTKSSSFWQKLFRKNKS